MAFPPGEQPERPWWTVVFYKRVYVHRIQLCSHERAAQRVIIAFCVHHCGRVGQVKTEVAVSSFYRQERKAEYAAQGGDVPVIERLKDAFSRKAGKRIACRHIGIHGLLEFEDYGFAFVG